MLDPHPHLKSFRIRIEKNSRSGSAKNESVSIAMDGTQNVLDHTLDLNLTEKKNYILTKLFGSNFAATAKSNLFLF